MVETFCNLNAAMAAGPGGWEPLWSDLMAELFPAITRPLTWEAEALLLAILRFEGRLRLTVASDLPHSMPPEDMLKSIAVQALGRWTGLAYVQEMERVRGTTPSSSLASLIRDVIQKTREEMKPRATKEGVIVGMIGENSKVVPRHLGREREMSYFPDVRIRRGPREREMALS